MSHYPKIEGEVQAGFPSPAAQYEEEELNLNELLVQHPAATFYLRAAGDSMVGAGIHHGDILVVDRSLRARDGSVVICCLANAFTVKYLRKDKDGACWLLAANPQYPPIPVREGEELRLFGVVTAVIHPFVPFAGGL